MTNTELVKNRYLKSITSGQPPCLFCGSSPSYITRSIEVIEGSMGLEAEETCSCFACDKDWVNYINKHGEMYCIYIHKLGTTWKPEELL